MSDKTIDTLFLVGAGSQENSWDPVITAINSCPIKGIGDVGKVTCAESATSFFATLANYRRHLHLIADDKTVAAAMREQARRMKPGLARSHRELKTCIATELRRAVEAGTIRLRPRFVQTFKEYWGKGSVAFLTTNWDPLLENELHTITGEKPRVRYLHGQISEPDLMLLPGEIVAERYRSDADRLRMQGLMSMWGPIERSRCIVIYGHSVSAIEAELRVMLCMGFSEATSGEILIVSLNKDARDIRQRVRPLIPPGREWQIELQPVD